MTEKGGFGREGRSDLRANILEEVHIDKREMQICHYLHRQIKFYKTMC